MSLHSVPPHEAAAHDEDTTSAAYMRGLIDGMERARLEAEAHEPPPYVNDRAAVPHWWLALLAGLVVVITLAATSLVIYQIDRTAVSHQHMLEWAEAVCVAGGEGAS